MSIKYKTILLLSFLATSAVSIAQQAHSSPYSYVGIGDISESGLAYNRGLGGLGIGMRSSYYLNGINPAALSAMDTLSFTFEFGASGEYLILESPSVTEPSMNGSIDYMALGFPITKWLKTSVGFKPYSRVGYDLTEYIDAKNNDDETLFTMRRDIKGEGGLNQVYLSNSVMFLKKFSVGLSLSYIFGQIKSTTTDTPSKYDPSISTYAEELTTRVSDFGYNFGFQYHDKINSKYKYTIGATYGVKNVLDTKTEVTMRSLTIGHSSTGDTLFTNQNLASSVSLPGFYGFGFSIGSEKLTLGVDYQYSTWSQSSITNKQEKYVDAQKVIVGLEYIPRPRTAVKYIHRMRYRLAGRLENSYMLINNNQLKDVGITFGVGLPMKRSKSTLNLAFDMGRTGTFTAGALSQTYFKFSLDLSLHDVWFIKRKYD